MWGESKLWNISSWRVKFMVTQRKKCFVDTKVPYFFISTDKFVGHSFIQIRKSCFFFFPKARKKKTQADFWNFWDFFLFFFFWSAEKFTCHSFIRFQSCFFFFRHRKKKKTAFSFIHSNFSKNAQKRTYPGKKKYGTFDFSFKIEGDFIFLVKIEKSQI